MQAIIRNIPSVSYIANVTGNECVWLHAYLTKMCKHQWIWQYSYFKSIYQTHCVPKQHYSVSYFMEYVTKGCKYMANLKNAQK